MRRKPKNPPANPAPSEVDVLIIGGGVTGISLAALMAQNKSLLLLEKRDFASGTSQASGMMVWGGLLYLKNFEFRLVWKYCRARDRMIGRQNGQVTKRKFTYMMQKKGGRSRVFVWLALQVYQAFSLWKRARLKSFRPENLDANFNPNMFSNGWTYEEGFLTESDARFALLQLQRENEKAHVANYQEVTSIRSQDDGGFQVDYQDTITGQKMQTRVGKIINCGGVWAEEINLNFGISTEHTHYLSKGVYLLLPASACTDAIIMDMEDHDDTLCWVPWGEVVMWGPTETKIDSLEEAVATYEDIDFLLDSLNRVSQKTWRRDDILNVRCGVRPLVNKPGKSVKYPLDLSRRAVVEKSPDRDWWTVFGGKLSGAADLAATIHRTIFPDEPIQNSSPDPETPPPPITKKYFLGRELPEPSYCREFEHCRTLEDYLRRRTNIAQWIPNSGFGKNYEFQKDLIAIAGVLLDDDGSAVDEVQAYREKVTAEKKQWNER
ncbi:MAG: FAD-dependent oxidoreductase [Akkermansiaceae bacterium]